MAGYTIDLSGKTAIVTGAGGGIGMTIAVKLAEAGAAIIASDISADAANKAVAAIEAAGGKASPLALDMGDRAAVAKAFAGLGAIDIIINNAGIFPRAELADVDDALWDKVMAVNLQGPFAAVRAAAPNMARGGVVVNISSIESFLMCNTGFIAYASSKAAVDAMTRGLAMELGPIGVRVNAIQPGIIDIASPTAGSAEARLAKWGAKIPARRLGQPADIAGAVLFLCSPLADFVHGESIVVDGGMTINA